MYQVVTIMTRNRRRGRCRNTWCDRDLTVNAYPRTSNVHRCYRVKSLTNASVLASRDYSLSRSHSHSHSHDSALPLTRGEIQTAVRVFLLFLSFDLVLLSLSLSLFLRVSPTQLLENIAIRSDISSRNISRLLTIARKTSAKSSRSTRPRSSY